MYTSNFGGVAPAYVGEPDAPYKTSPANFPPLAIESDTHVTKTLAPGQPGTLGWSRLHDTALVCVRYRESADGSRRYTTIELVVDERINRRPKPPRRIAVTVEPYDQKTRQRLIAAGGVWDAKKKIWLVPETKTTALTPPPHKK